MRELTLFVCFSEKEFRILLNYYGIRSLNAFEMTEEYEGARESLQNAYDRGVYDLYRKKLLTFDGEKAVFDRETESIFRALKMSKSAVHFESSESTVSSLCLFLSGENTVLMEPGAGENEYARLCVIETDELPEFLVESGIMKAQETPEGISSDIISEEDLNAEEKEVFSVEDSFSASVYGTVSIMKTVFFDIIVTESNGRKTACPYSPGKVVEELMLVAKNV